MEQTENTSLALISRASQALAEADTVVKLKELKDIALTAADWLKRKRAGEDVIQQARNLALDAARKMGFILMEMEKAKPGPEKKDRSALTTDPPTLADLGISKDQSSDAQQLAKLPEEVLKEVKTGKKTITQVKREQKRKETVIKVQSIPSDKYRVIYADLPWKYGDQLTENYGATRFHYPSMSIKELCLLPIAELAEENAVLFLWVTSPLLEECFPVVHAWAFNYKASFIWDKVKHNMGHYNSVRHEMMLVCTRGSCLPDVPELIDSVQSIERTDKHSEKPEEFRNIIDKLYPHGKRIELFARTTLKEPWETWGNE